MAHNNDEFAPLLQTLPAETGDRPRKNSEPFINLSDSPVTIITAGPDLETGVADSSQATGITRPALNKAALIQVIAVLGIGIFTSNLDSSFVIATHPRISSDFDALEDSSWILISFYLAGAGTQTLYAGLSDIYGRKWLLIFCYAIFAAGCATIGLAGSMWQVILGRAIQGSGGSGMASLGMILTTDLIPLRDVATWLGYINIVSTTGRSLGGPVGGWMTDRLGWRWSFLGQTPLFLTAIVCCILVIPNTKTASANAEDAEVKGNSIAQMDFAGALLLGVSILTLMLPLELGGTKLPWTHPVIAILFVSAVSLLCLFLAVELWWARNPIVPVRLLKNREVLASYAISALMGVAQFGIFYFVPLYFQVTQRVTNTAAGVHLVPAVVGNALGGLTAGGLIRRTKGYRTVTMGASLVAALSYLLCILRWRGNTNWWESLYIGLGGFGAGIINSCVFVSINAAVDPGDKAVAASGMFLAMPVGMMTGVAIGSAVMLQKMRSLLDEQLLSLGLGAAARQKIIEGASANVDYLTKLEGRVAEAVVTSYVEGLRYSYGVSLVAALLTFAAALALRDHRLS